ncbi:MAG TPA: hypothetical protein VF152_13905 [Acidimicrobiia bacterium]
MDARRVTRPQAFPAGTRVEVFSSFRSSWAAGFEVATGHDGGYQILRLSDRTILPKTFLAEDLRAHRV